MTELTLDNLTIVPLKAACTKLNCSERKLREELFAAGFSIIEFSPRKRGVLLHDLGSFDLWTSQARPFKRNREPSMTEQTIDQIDQKISSYEDRISAAGYDPETGNKTEAPEKDNPSIFDESREAELKSQLGKIYDRNHAAAERAEEAKIVPSVKPADSLNEAYEKTWEYLHASPKERATQRDASQLVEQVRANAAKFGVELSDADAMKAAMELERDQARTAPLELAPAMEAIQKNYPDMKPHEVVGRYAEIDNYVKRAPAEAAGWIYQQATGQSPLELARHIASQHSPQQHQAFYIERDVNTFFQLVPEAEKFQNQIVTALERGEIQRTGNIIQDMQRVYQHVRGSKPQSRNGARRSMESEMEETWNRVNRK